METGSAAGVSAVREKSHSSRENLGFYRPPPIRERASHIGPPGVFRLDASGDFCLKQPALKLARLCMETVPSPDFPSFAELYVISDLHLGGAPGHQIFERGAQASTFIKSLAAKPPESAVGLVINGDLVDFLAEENATWFDPEGAIPKLERIAGDDAFRPVFDALRSFTATPGRHLAITLGNHDLELALPWVRQRFLEMLGKDEAARGRITLAFEGAGYRCRVGPAEVLCIHGNEVDEWNVTDHEQIRRIGREITQGRCASVWKPNAGTRMVIEVMNEIKRDHPFVDLLKPEFGAVVPTLLHLAPHLAMKIADVARVGLRMKWDDLRMRAGFLSGEVVAEKGERPQWEPAREDVLRRFLGGAGGVGATNAGLTAEDLMAQVEAQFEQGRTPLDLIQPGEDGAKLGWTLAVWKKWTGKSDAEILRAAIDGVQRDQSFKPDVADETFRRLDEKMGANLDYVIAGHTHLRRALRRTRGSGHYYNTGTWVRLIQLTKEQLKSEPAFKKIYASLQATKMADLDNSEHIMRVPTAACIQGNGSGCLYQIGEKGEMTEVKDSRFPRK